ncbi:nuclear pore protein-like protein [Colletotrichum musicola]|uniref:Nuclear pore protein-like protein n=1 Tax=Colletotrichum musicola TaxID=2175873 RepID=A0A8H6N6Y6_9PEZI|nr:nuclear pore protein-like protein [Colletotrichum musicola]
MEDRSQDTGQVDDGDKGVATPPIETNATPAAATSPIEDVRIDPDGDLILRAGSELQDPAKSFLVCSSALRRSSAVWKTMLFGPFKESKPASGAWEVDLPEDNPSGLWILLHIVHANFRMVPRTPTLTELYEVLRLANKYDMISAVKPWAKTWLSVVEHFSTLLICRI